MKEEILRKVAIRFLAEHLYTTSANSKLIDIIFEKAVQKFLTNSINDLCTLGFIVETFQTNPYVYRCTHRSKIFKATDLTFYLAEDSQEEVENIVKILSELKWIEY